MAEAVEETGITLQCGLTGALVTDRQEGAGRGARIRESFSEAERLGRQACKGPAGYSHAVHWCLWPGWLPSMAGAGVGGRTKQKHREWATFSRRGREKRAEAQEG